jgi:glycerol-3-phosphate acyltransferase PlsY
VLLGLVGLAYLIGSIPFGLLVGKLRGVDIRLHGSCNIGATNAGRVLGRRWGYLVLGLDVLKSFLPTVAASVVVLATSEPVGRTRLTFLLWVGVGAAAVLGHVFPIFAKFKGGKGVACGLGMLLGVWPYATLPGLIGGAAYAAARFGSGYVSLGSLAGSAAAVVSWAGLGWLLGWDIFGRQLPLGLVLVTIAGLIWWRHRTNIKRLLRGEEHRLDPAKPVR